MKKKLLALLALCTASANAEVQSGRIAGYIPHEVGDRQLLIFNLEGNVSGGCNTTARFALDSSTAKFKGVQAAILAAYHSQSPVAVIYAQTCNAWGNAWDASVVCVGNVPC